MGALKGFRNGCIIHDPLTNWTAYKLILLLVYLKSYYFGQDITNFLLWRGFIIKLLIK